MKNKSALLMQFDVLNTWFKNALTDISDEESNQRVNKNMNHIKYLAGHLVFTQNAYFDIAGEIANPRWKDLFEGLTKTKALDNFPYPSITEIEEEWNKTYQFIKEKLAALTEDDLSKILKGTPLGDISVGDLWTFINLHQCYHIGQLGILRRGLGKEPMKYS